MKILNFGSLNIDHVYSVNEFVKPGETLLSNAYNMYSGGKGLNQSVAIAKTGLPVYHAGLMGQEGKILLHALRKENINTEFIKTEPGASGHAIIQVNRKGENCIILHGGQNQNISKEYIDQVLSNFKKDDFLILQNEISNTEHIIHSAKKRKMKIIFNPAPINEQIDQYPIELVDYLICNEIEAQHFAQENTFEETLAIISDKFKSTTTILTAGAKGVYFKAENKIEHLPSRKVEVVDTTSAGDTFIGYLVYGLFKNHTLQASIELATNAAAITVTRKGAAESIPNIDEVLALGSIKN